MANEDLLCFSKVLLLPLGLNIYSLSHKAKFPLGCSDCLVLYGHLMSAPAVQTNAFFFKNANFFERFFRRLKTGNVSQ